MPYKIEMKEQEIIELFNSFNNKKILIIGDVMIDAYVWGKVKRISPEAPVPVLNSQKKENRLGGAANVANNIIHLGANPIPIGIIGSDQHGEIFKELMQKEGITSEAIFEVSDRPTTTKVRVIADNQHIVRIDKEALRID